MGDSKIKEVDTHTPSADTVLPQTRIRTIMKGSQDTGQISTDVLFLLTKCTEKFVQYLTREGWKCAKRGAGSNSHTTLKYEHLAEVVNTQTELEFLLQIIPEKITVHEFKEMLKESIDSDDSDEESD